MDPQTRLQIEQDPRSREIFLSGELDVANADDSARILAAMTGGAGDWTLDLSGLTFLDCAGVRVLVALADSLFGELRLTELGPHLRKVLHLLDVPRRAPNMELDPPEPARAAD